MMTEKKKGQRVSYPPHPYSIGFEGSDKGQVEKLVKSLSQVLPYSVNLVEPTPFLDRDFRSFSYSQKDFSFYLHNSPKQVKKIMILPENWSFEQLEEDQEEGKLQGILAFIGKGNYLRENLLGRPFFEFDHISKISKWIEDYFWGMANQKKIYGLVLAGGKSKRMGTDKGALNYWGKSQVEHNLDLLSPLCDEVFISIRDDKEVANHLKGLERYFLADKYGDLGPMGALFGAFEKDQDAYWLVLACDMPFVKAQHLKYLIKNKDPFKVATTYINPEKGWPSPLCALYGPNAFKTFWAMAGLDFKCPRKVLEGSNIKAIEIDSEENFLANINTPEELLLAQKELGDFKKESQL